MNSIPYERELYYCSSCGKVNLHWGDCWSCGYDSLTPKSEIKRLYEASKAALDTIERFQIADYMQYGQLTRDIEEAERRNWEG